MKIEQKFEKDICTINFAAIFAYLDQLGKDTTLITEKTGLSRNFLTDRREYIDLPTGIIIFDVVKEVLNEKDPMIFYDIGIEAARLNSYGVLVDIAQFLGNVKESVKFIPRFNRKFSDLFNMDVFNVKKNSATVTIFYKKKKYDGVWIFDQCAWNQGNIAGMPLIWNMPSMNVEEELCRFNLKEIIRDYHFMNHHFELKNGRAYLNGKEFATRVTLGVEYLERSTDKLERMNPLGKLKKVQSVFSKKNYETLKIDHLENDNDKPSAMLITRDTRISERLTLKEGQIFGAPCCKLNVQWEDKKSFYKPLKGFALEKLTNFGSIIRQLEEELDVNIKQKKELIKSQEKLKAAHIELQHYATDLEKMVDKRTADLKQTQAKLHEAEKRSLEHRITGGFAHEMRNALTGAQLELITVLNYQNTDKALAELIKDSASQLLKKINDIQTKYNIPKEEIANQLIPEIKTLSKLSDHLYETMIDVSKDLERGLSITSQIRDYAKLSDLRPGTTSVNIIPMLNEYALRYSQDFERIGTQYSIEGLETAIVKAEEIHLNSIFSNIIINACDALEDFETDRGKMIKVNVGSTKDDNKDNIVIQISDNGPGIAENHLKEIFEPFFSTKPKSGTGLGLGIVNKLVQLYDGQINIESKKGKATIFTVTLPAELNKE